MKDLYKKYKDVMPYLFFGVCTTIINVAIYWISVHFMNLPVMVSTIIAWFLAVLFAYITNRKWVFHSKAKGSGEIIREILSFFVCRLTTGVVDWMCMLLFVDILGLNDIIIKFIDNVVVIILNYVASKLAIFKNKERESIHEKNIKSLMAALSILIFLTIAGIFMVRNKLTYLEFTAINEESNTYIEINQTGEELIQEFYMPYDIMKGFSIKIGTFDRDNNSEWKVLITDAETDSVIYTDHFNASLISDNNYYYIKFDKNIRLDRESLYKIHIIADKVNIMTGLAFYRMDQPVEGHNEELYYNGSGITGMLCFRIYGGDIDNWWIGLILFFAVVFSFVVIRFHLVRNKEMNPKEDLVLQSLAIGLLAFFLLFSFAVTGTFTDEFDNMRGGMIIAKGGVLYTDYVTQHMPVTYYLCGIFALLGAGSVQQFRLSYYIFVAAVWALLYFWHESYFGKKKMLVLSILECIFISSIISPQGSQILSDGVQGLCMVVLSLEFIRYYKDKKLNWIRSIIVSISIWVSFGSVFVSAYALIWVVLIFFAVEIKNWTTKKFSVKVLIDRYCKLLIAAITPFICAAIYFKVNHSLKRAFDQFYTFNREVYSKCAVSETL